MCLLALYLGFIVTHAQIVLPRADVTVMCVCVCKLTTICFSFASSLSFAVVGTRMNDAKSCKRASSNDGGIPTPKHNSNNNNELHSANVVYILQFPHENMPTRSTLAPLIPVRCSLASYIVFIYLFIYGWNVGTRRLNAFAFIYIVDTFVR